VNGQSNAFLSKTFTDSKPFNSNVQYIIELLIFIHISGFARYLILSDIRFLWIATTTLQIEIIPNFFILAQPCTCCT